MNDLSLKARALIISTILFGTLSIVVNIVLLENHGIGLVILAVLTSVTQILKVEGATEKSNYSLSWILYGFTLILYGVPATMFVIVVAHLVEWVRYKYPWYIQMYNMATYGISLVLADLVYTTFISSQSAFTLSFAIGLLTTAFCFTLTNHFLIGLVIWFARGQNFRESGIFGRLTLTIDLTLIILGIAAAMLWQINPFIAPFVLIPIFLIQNSLKLPAMQRQTEVEPKTKLYNARFFATSLEKELERAISFNRPLTLVLGDLDLLRDINNNYGHVAGDVVLVGVANILKDSFRDSDLVARFGGEEFAIMMPGIKPEEAYLIVEAVRKEIAAAEFNVDTSVTPIHATISFGISGIDGDTDQRLTTTDLTNNADSALYNSKLSGRNQTNLYAADYLDELFKINQENKPPKEEAHTQTPITARFDKSSQKTTKPEDDMQLPNYKLVKSVSSQLSALKVRQPWQVNAYVGIVILIATGLAILSFHRYTQPINYLGILVFTGIIILGEVFSIEIYNKDSSVSIAAAFLIAGSVLYGPLGALIFSFAIAITAMFKNRTPVIRLLFNASNHLISSILLIALLSSFAPSFGDALIIVQLLIALLSGIIVFSSTTLILSGVLHFSEEKPLISIWREKFFWLIPYYFAFGVISFAMIIGYSSAGLIGLIAIATPLAILRLSQVQYINKTKSMVKKLHDTNAELNENNQLISKLNEDILLSLANTIDLRDSYTLGHSTSVSQIAVLIAHELGLPSDQIDAVRKSCLLHDIGKIGIPDRILFKPDQLTDDEFEIIKTHPSRGAAIVKNNVSLEHLAPIIRHHHEHYDGKGYPDGLIGEEIPFESRILCLADSVQAMSSNRPYRKRLNLATVKAEVKKYAGTQFDPKIASIFLELLEKDKITLEIPIWSDSELTHSEYLEEIQVK